MTPDPKASRASAARQGGLTLMAGSPWQGSRLYQWVPAGP